MNRIILNGITWEHSRGYTPLVASSQRFSELHPEVEIRWQKRSLQEFADFPLEQLASHYDLLIIDHPWVGRAAVTQSVLPLDEYLSVSYLEDQLKNSVGQSHLSYHYDDHQWALAIDAATPVASYRNDLLQKNNIGIPETWKELIAMAEKKRVAVPGVSIDLLMNFYMFCLAHGNVPFQNQEQVIDHYTGQLALETMRELWSLTDKKMFEYNPIDVAELMTTTDNYYYCPFAYGYSNYSRKYYAENMLSYSDLIEFNHYGKLKSTIGGTGIAVSSSSASIDWAVHFTEWIVSPNIQSGIYAGNGGQPGHRAAWLNQEVNSYSHNYFADTLPALERGYMRPRYNGYLEFQDKAGDYIREYLKKGGTAQIVLNSIDHLYKKSRL
ncbi:ABC transporter substrate-binding protein [Pedobacter lusitanus]|uniref:ABC transporter substrate-binding protein n=1 Tax=Pedobacter lusitanus TaxID=1503925 RepID=A0A0D0GLM0_9SPHI|nr:extracellular solute-binding protein [Pedobacter lusitanus]KIO75291.1 ABC transporter substrate-binding protein [Pedobacter lusitanus]